MSNPFDIIPWGTTPWGIPYTSPPPTNMFVNIINIVPTPGSFNIEREQTFTFTIKTRFALNPNTTYVMLDNKLVINGLISNTTDFTIVVSTNIDGISKDYSITPKYLFKDGAILTLQISATDTYGNPAPSFWGGYIVIDARPQLVTPIYPLNGDSRVPLDLSLHFLVNQLASPDSGFDNSTLNVNVNNIPAVISGVIQPNYDGEYSIINMPNNITDPIEVVLDYLGRYSSNEIITVDVSIKETGTIPIIGSNGFILNANGVVAGQNVVVSNLTKLAAGEYNLTLNAALSTYLLPDIVVSDGYQFKDTNGNVFKIAIVGIQELTVQTSAKQKTSKFSFITDQFYEEITAPIFAGYFQGVYLVDNLGDGYHINVTWHSAKTTRPDNDLAYLIYYSTTRSDVFYEGPKLITQGRSLPRPETIHGADAQLFGSFAQITLPVGVTYYFGVRATEFPHYSTLPPFIPADGYGINIAGRTVVDGYSFRIPLPQTLLSNVSGIGAIVITVATTTGFVNTNGYITVGTEIMAYTSKTTTTFTVGLTGRGLFGTTIASTHSIGEAVRLYYGNYDDNSVISKNLVSWEAPNDSHRTRKDLITTDFTLEDAYGAGFEPYDYCGYHSQYPDLLFTEQQCNTYVGGEVNGVRGLFLTDRLIANQEQLLDTTGEPVVLLKRIWQGETCICRTSRKDSPRVRSCSICFGTGFKGGFVQYKNPRRNDQRIMVHFAPSDEDIGMGAQSGWDQKFKPNAWTLRVPSIKDRDYIVKFDYEDKNKIQWIYVVNTVSRGETVLGVATRQRLNISRIDRTDVIYQMVITK